MLLAVRVRRFLRAASVAIGLTAFSKCMVGEGETRNKLCHFDLYSQSEKRPLEKATKFSTILSNILHTSEYTIAKFILFNLIHKLWAKFV